MKAHIQINGGDFDPSLIFGVSAVYIPDCGRPGSGWLPPTWSYAVDLYLASNKECLFLGAQKEDEAKAIRSELVKKIWPQFSETVNTKPDPAIPTPAKLCGTCW